MEFYELQQKILAARKIYIRAVLQLVESCVSITLELQKTNERAVRSSLSEL